jgi:mRNA-degrading endonuclease RelE of RelBE toxin-antitoxin system
MVNVEYDSEFQKIFSKLDSGEKEKVKPQIKKVLSNPKIGKPMRYARKGTRELYIKPFRLSYAYLQNEDKIIFLDLYHKDKQ